MSKPSHTPTVLVSGGGGFIGRAVVPRFLQGGWRVKVFDLNLNPALPFASQVELIRGDFGDTPRVLDALAGAEVLVHLIHTTVPGSSMQNVEFDIASNVIPTARLLAQLPAESIPHVVYVSSGGTVYGLAHTLPIDETHPTNPFTSYGITKLAIEKYLMMYSQLKGFTCTILRPSNAYGVGQDVTRQQGAVGVFLDRFVRRQPIVMWGDGSIVRDYVHVSDLAEAVVHAANYRDKQTIWNVSSERGVSLLELIEIIERVGGRKADVRFEPRRGMDVPANILRNQRIRQATGWRVQTALEDGIREVYRSMVE